VRTTAPHNAAANIAIRREVITRLLSSLNGERTRIPQLDPHGRAFAHLLGAAHSRANGLLIFG
jgi:hypothetical protein